MILPKERITKALISAGLHLCFWQTQKTGFLLLRLIKRGPLSACSVFCWWSESGSSLTDWVFSLQGTTFSIFSAFNLLNKVTTFRTYKEAIKLYIIYVYIFKMQVELKQMSLCSCSAITRERRLWSTNTFMHSFYSWLIQIRF